MILLGAEVQAILASRGPHFGVVLETIARAQQDAVPVTPFRTSTRMVGMATKG